MKDPRSGRLSATEYIEGILKGDRVMLSRAITLIESTLQTDLELSEQVLTACLPHSGNVYRIGITGSPGVGKSTFIDFFGEMIIQNGLNVAVLAVDPSSVHSKGSILGDKTRMSTLARSSHAFIRPSPTSGVLGGVANRTREAMILCEAAGFEVVLVETVGVGQSEVMVKEMVDHFLLLVLPHAGDDLQGIKRGIMEMADTILVHKADGDMMKAAKLSQAQYRQALQYSSHKSKLVKVFTGSSVSGDGIEQLWIHLQNIKKQMKETGEWEQQREHQTKYWFNQSLTEAFIDLLDKDNELNTFKEQMSKRVISKEISPRQAARELLNKWLGYSSC